MTTPALTAPNMSPFDCSPPHRPGTTDFNGAACTDDPKDPPPDGTFPTAEDYNTKSLSIVAVGAVVPIALVDISLGVSPVVNSVACAVTAYNTPSAMQALLTITRNAAGDYLIQWNQALLPPRAVPPAVLALYTDMSDPGWTCTPTATGSHVKIYSGVTLTDSRILFAIY